MPYGIKKLLEIDAERKRKREEKARIKAEKEKQKKEEKKIARQKRLKKLRNQRYQKKVRKKREEYHKSIGDEKGVFSIYLMKNGKRCKFFKKYLYKVAATQKFYELLHENNDKVKYNRTLVKQQNNFVPQKMELVLTKYLPNGKDKSISSFRDEDGKFIESVITDSDNHKIIAKEEWLVEETFHVYGYDPMTDRKDFDFIFNNIILKNTDRYTRVFVYRNYIIHHYDDDFDMVKCKTKGQAIDVYNKIEKMIDKKKYKNIFFMDKVTETSEDWIIDEIEKKTGWSHGKCLRSSN